MAGRGGGAHVRAVLAEVCYGAFVVAVCAALSALLMLMAVDR